MGFRPGTQVTVDNALKMMLVKSANDMAVVLAEGVGGSIDGFSAEMNATAQRLGMTQTSYVNPNGLPADGQITSARDMAILARAIIQDLPEYEYFVHIPSIRYGRRVTHNFNKLIGRFPGADGFKTGFICASGYNLVGSATRNGKRLIAVVLGTSSGTMRAVRAAQMLERGFANNTLSWLRPALGTVDKLAPIAAAPPNLRDEMCGPKRKHPASDEDEESVASNSSAGGEAVMSFFATGAQPPTLRPVDMIAAAAGALRTPLSSTPGRREPEPPLPPRPKPMPRGTLRQKANGRRSLASKRGGAAAPKAEANADPKGKQRVSVTIKPEPKPAGRAKGAAVKRADAKSSDAKPTATAEKPKTARGAKGKPKPKNATTGEAKPAGDQKPRT